MGSCTCNSMYSVPSILLYVCVCVWGGGGVKVVLQARPFLFHSADRFSMPILKAISAVEQKGSGLQD